MDETETANETPDEQPTPVCPICMEPIERFNHFCPHCGAPVSAIASSDPLGQVYAQGWIYRRVNSGSPSLIAVIGMWLLFGPGMVGFAIRMIFGASDIARSLRGAAAGRQITPMPVGMEVLTLVFCGLSMVLFAAILWQVTARYLRARGRGGPAAA